MNLYARDKNSSTLREFITLSLAGYQWQGRKLGFEGRKEHNGETIYAEVKPKNLEREKGGRFNGGGNFTDFRQERLDRYLAAKPQMLVSGFLDGELVYILEFPFQCAHFLQHLQGRLDHWLQGRQRRPGEYLRSLEFDWRHYRECNVRSHLLNPRIVATEPRLFDNAFRAWILAIEQQGRAT